MDGKCKANKVTVCGTDTKLENGKCESAVVPESFCDVNICEGKLDEIREKKFEQFSETARDFLTRVEFIEGTHKFCRKLDETNCGHVSKCRLLTEKEITDNRGKNRRYLNEDQKCASNELTNAYSEFDNIEKLGFNRDHPRIRELFEQVRQEQKDSQTGTEINLLKGVKTKLPFEDDEP